MSFFHTEALITLWNFRLDEWKRESKRKKNNTTTHTLRLLCWQEWDSLEVAVVKETQFHNFPLEYIRIEFVCESSNGWYFIGVPLSFHSFMRLKSKSKLINSIDNISRAIFRCASELSVCKGICERNEHMDTQLFEIPFQLQFKSVSVYALGFSNVYFFMRWQNPYSNMYTALKYCLVLWFVRMQCSKYANWTY